MRQTSLMKTIKDGRSSLHEGLGSKGMLNQPYSIDERVMPEIRNLDTPRGRRSSILVRGVKYNQSICFEQKPLILVTLEEFFPRDFFKQVAVNRTSCSVLEDEEDEEHV